MKRKKYNNHSYSQFIEKDVNGIYLTENLCFYWDLNREHKNIKEIKEQIYCIRLENGLEMREIERELSYAMIKQLADDLLLRNNQW